MCLTVTPSLKLILPARHGQLLTAADLETQIKKLSLIVVLLKRLFRREGAVPEFYYRDGQYPEQVNFLRPHGH
jgi:hypothetical protein